MTSLLPLTRLINDASQLQDGLCIHRPAAHTPRDQPIVQRIRTSPQVPRIDIIKPLKRVFRTYQCRVNSIGPPYGVDDIRKDVRIDPVRHRSMNVHRLFALPAGEQVAPPQVSADQDDNDRHYKQKYPERLRAHRPSPRRRCFRRVAFDCLAPRRKLMNAMNTTPATIHEPPIRRFATSPPNSCFSEAFIWQSVRQMAGPIVIPDATAHP